MPFTAPTTNLKGYRIQLTALHAFAGAPKGTTHPWENLSIDVIDGSDDSSTLLQGLVRFRRDRRTASRRLPIAFDAHACVNRSLRQPLLEGLLGAAPARCVTATPLKIFGGGFTPIPPHYGHRLASCAPCALPLRGRLRGDGDAQLVLGRVVVNTQRQPGSITANAHLGAGLFRRPLAGVARSMPRAPLWMLVPRSWAIPFMVTPRAGSSSATCLMPAASASAARESFGTGSDQYPRKRWLWA